MKYQVIPPCNPLADYVDYFWILEGEASHSAPFSIRTPANAFAELIIHYKGLFSEISPDGACSRSFVSGIHSQNSQYRDFAVTDHFGMLGVRLFPYALNALFGVPAAEYTNSLPDLLSLLKPHDHYIHEQVMNASDNLQRISIITRFLTMRIKESPRSDIMCATQKIIKENGQANIDALLRDYALSQRQFERLFKEHVGFTPKRFSRIVRFNALMKFARQQRSPISLTELAYEHGYYDQSHFIQEFREFTGETPRVYFSHRQIYA